MSDDSRTFPRSVKRAAYKRSGGRCEHPDCRTLFPKGGGGVEYDHIIPWWISHNSSLSNCEVLCVRCHKLKTGSKDAPTIAKCRTLSDAEMGIKRPGKKLPAGRNSNITKKLNGSVEERLTGAEKHQRAMADRYSFGWRPE